jgi:hypothetical protein
MKLSPCFVLAAFCCLPFCAKDPVSTISPITATEEWKITVPSTLNNANMSLHEHRDGTLSCSGNWYYDFYGNDITCKIMNGGIVKDTAYLTFNCTGIASYPPDSSGSVESSAFTLTMKGTFKNGHASGTWDIGFVDEEWDGWAPEGVFNGERVTGDAVTD